MTPADSFSIDRTRPRPYWTGGRGYFAVSQVVAVLRGQPILEAEPTAAMQRGSDVHAICAVEAAHRAGWVATGPTVPALYTGYWQSYCRWLDHVRPSVVAVEEPRIHPCLPYAGTPDLLCLIGERETIVEIKTGPIESWHRLQLLAYSRLEGIARNAVLVVLSLDALGGLPHVRTVQPSRADWAAFRAALSVLLWREQETAHEHTDREGGR